jgi:hypothetical protein
MKKCIFAEWNNAYLQNDAYLQNETMHNSRMKKCKFAERNIAYLQNRENETVCIT